MYRSTLVPLDGSTFGEHALPLAVSLAHRSGATLQLVHVHTPYLLLDSRFLYDKEVDRHLREQGQSYLEDVVQRLRAATTVRVGYVFREGLVADAILEELTTNAADLVVMTTHGHGPLSRFWLGSVADELLRRSTVPVLFLRPQEISPGSQPESALRHVVIPLDGSALAEQVLEPAVALGRLLKADFTLLRVVKPVLFPGHDPTALENPPPELPATEQIQAEARAYLESVAKRLRAQSLEVQTRVLVDMQPAVAILGQSLELAESVLTVATHGCGGLPRAVLGSVADKVVRGATAPVLVYRPLRE
jgi:nucleotide-binding universal stress UspA family protein